MAFQLPLFGSGSWNALGDGVVESLTDPAAPSHEYISDGTYTVRVAGALMGDARFGMGSARYDGSRMVTSLDAWGDLGLTSLRGAFSGTQNLKSVPADLPASVTDTSYMFAEAQNFEQDLSRWCVEEIPSAPIGFSDGARSWLPHNRPNWGERCYPPD